MSAVVYAPSTVTALTQMIKTRVRTYHIVQPDLITPGHMYIAEHMSHVPVQHNRHTQRQLDKSHVYLRSQLTLVPATGGIFTPSVVFAENHQLNNGLRQLVFVTLSQTLLAF